jgi:hypothetical protein
MVLRSFIHSKSKANEIDGDLFPQGCIKASSKSDRFMSSKDVVIIASRDNIFDD